jgi:hypothetical protein
MSANITNLHCRKKFIFLRLKTSQSTELETLRLLKKQIDANFKETTNAIHSETDDDTTDKQI